MESKETEFKGGYLNGFLMCVIDILLLCATIWAFIQFVSYPSVGRVILCVLLFIAFIFFSCGFCMQEPNEAKVLTFFGRYVGTFRKTGFYWVNPLMTKKSVSLRARNLNAEPIKVNDKNGNPILIGLVVVWRLKDTYKAIFDIDTDVTNTAAVGSAASARMNKFQNFVAVQSDSALRQVAMAGLEVTEARINYLAYAPEIAAVMLRRQQAEAIISAREKIVEGAVGMVKMALDKLGDENIVELDEEKKAAMVSNLLVVLCADEPAQPVINSGTLNH